MFTQKMCKKLAYEVKLKINFQVLLKFQAGFNIFSKMKKQKFKSFHWLIIIQTYRKRKKATLTLMHMQYLFSDADVQSYPRHLVMLLNVLPIWWCCCVVGLTVILFSGSVIQCFPIGTGYNMGANYSNLI